jgi:hypothetical protein
VHVGGARLDARALVEQAHGLMLDFVLAPATLRFTSRYPIVCEVALFDPDHACALQEVALAASPDDGTVAPEHPVELPLRGARPGTYTAVVLIEGRVVVRLEVALTTAERVVRGGIVRGPGLAILGTGSDAAPVPVGERIRRAQLAGCLALCFDLDFTADWAPGVRCPVRVTAAADGREIFRRDAEVPLEAPTLVGCSRAIPLDALAPAAPRKLSVAIDLGRRRVFERTIGVARASFSSDGIIVEDAADVGEAIDVADCLSFFSEPPPPG